jgi:predicted esterase
MEQTHEGQSVYAMGVKPEEAQVAMVMVHGRGASAADILTIAQELNVPGVAYIAPQAAGNQWYPHRFIERTERNEPWLTSALQTVDAVLAHVRDAGIPAARTILLGFSQGACLALEYAARNPRRYGGLVGLSGAMIENGDRPREYTGSLEGTPVFLGCGEPDPHIPEGRLQRSAVLLRDLGGEVTLKVYPGMGHTVNEEELGYVREIVRRVQGESGAT